MKISPLQLIGALVVITAIQSFLHLPLINGARSSNSNIILDAYPSPRLYPHKLANRTMIFVHVGKTGGETIKWRLQVVCNLRGSQRKKARCFEQFTRGESRLSHATIGYTHCGSQRPKNTMAAATMFLFSIRDPIDRIVSWFQYMNPQNCIPERPSGACNLKKDSSTTWGKEFFELCFHSVDTFVRSMKSPLIQASINCSLLAIEAVQGNGPKAQSNHLYYNYHYNFNRTVRAFPGRDIVVVRRESLWDDMRSIETLLGGDTARKFEHEGPVITHGSEKFLYKARLDSALVASLCCTIPDEVLVYVNVLSRALNLDVVQKEASITALLSKCKADSFKSLFEQCRWNTDNIPADLVPTTNK